MPKSIIIFTVPCFVGAKIKKFTRFSPTCMDRDRSMVLLFKTRVKSGYTSQLGHSLCHISNFARQLMMNT